MESSSVVLPAENCLNDNYPIADDNCEDVEDGNGDKHEYRAPCLVCGTDLEATFPPLGGGREGEVKQEVDVDVEDEFGGNLNEDDGYHVGGEGVHTETAYLADVGTFTSKEDNISLYHWFLKLFSLEENSDKKGRRDNRDIGLWWGAEEPQIPFCLLCKNELIQLLEFKRKVEELEKLIQLGRKDLKERCRTSEIFFERKNVYQNDNRYRAIRQRIINVKSNESTKPSSSPSRKRKKARVKEFPQSPPPNPEVGNLSVRKSVRQSKTVVKYDPSWFDEDDFNFPLNASSIPGAIPMVLLSTSDKVIAEQYLPNPLTSQNNSKKNKSSESKQNRKPKPPKSKKVPRKSLSNIKIDPDTNTNDLATNYPEGPQETSPFRHFEDNFDDNDNHDDDDHKSNDDEDFNPNNNPTQKNKKRKKPKDEDFVPSDLQLQEEDEHNSSNSDDDLPSHKRDKASVVHDPLQNTLSFNNITFKQAGPPEDSMYECTSCNVKVHNSKGRVRYHVIKCHTTVFACSKCDYRGGRPNELRNHVNRVHKRICRRVYYDKPCEICGKPVNMSHTKSHLWTHMNKEEKKEARLKEEQKEKEGKSFLHFVVKKYQCDECGRKFSIPSTLEKHIKKVHEGKKKGEMKDKEELCPECGMKFANLQIHMVKKHGDRVGDEEKRKFECMEPGCGKKFKDNAQLWRHKDCVHRNLRPWKCTMCTRAFGKKMSLDNHMKLHMGIREWKCELCDGMGFARKHHLERHRQTFHEDGCRPRRKGYMRGPTTIGMGWTKGELVKKGSYYPPSALASWAQGRVPGYLVEEKKGAEGEAKRGDDNGGGGLVI